MHLGMPECHKPFLGHCDLDLWPSFQELLCPEHIFYIIWCRNPNFGMAEWCIPFWVTLTLTLTSGLISRFLVLYYSYLSSNASYARPMPLGAFVTCLWHFLFYIHFILPRRGPSLCMPTKSCFMDIVFATVLTTTKQRFSCLVCRNLQACVPCQPLPAFYLFEWLL